MLVAYVTALGVEAITGKPQPTTQGKNEAAARNTSISTHNPTRNSMAIPPGSTDTPQTAWYRSVSGGTPSFRGAFK